MPTSDIQRELRQLRPFRSLAQETAVALMRTTSLVERVVARVVNPAGLSLAQYNVLRILRGAGAAGLPTLAIRERMIDQGAAITRLLDKLEAAGYVTRSRTAEDRRQVRVLLAPPGAALLDELDPLVDAADADSMRGLDAAGQQALQALLQRVRAAIQEPVGEEGSPSDE